MATGEVITFVVNYEFLINCLVISCFVVSHEFLINCSIYPTWQAGQSQAGPRPDFRQPCFLHLQLGTGEAVANDILTLLGRNGLDVSNICGQSYNVASAMAGTHTST